MVDSRKRASASLKVKYKSTTLSQFVSQFGLDISHAGMFIKTKTPLEPGALIRLELQLSDGMPVIVGSGRVRWRRVIAATTQAPAGMGIEFTRLDPESRRFVDSIVDAREGRPSRFEQTEGAEHAAPSTKNASVPPTLSAPAPASIQPPDSMPPEPTSPPPPPAVPPPPAAQPAMPPPAVPPPAAQPALPPPTPQPRAVRTSLPPGASGLFAGSRLGGAPSTDPSVEAPTQSSFFGPGRAMGAAPSHPSQTPTRTSGARESSVIPMRVSRPDAADKMVDKLFADAIPKSDRPGPATADSSEDLVTSEFRGPDLGRDDSAIATIPPLSLTPDDGPRDPTHPPPRPASQRSPNPVLKAPSQFPAALTSDSGFPKPAKSTALIIAVLAALTLAAATLFYLLQ